MNKRNRSTSAAKSRPRSTRKPAQAHCTRATPTDATRRARSLVMTGAARLALEAYQGYILAELAKAWRIIEAVERWASDPDAPEPECMRRFGAVYRIMHVDTVDDEETAAYARAEAEYDATFGNLLTDLTAAAADTVLQVATGHGHGLDRQIEQLRRAAKEQAGEWVRLGELLEGAIDQAIGESDRKERDRTEVMERGEWADRREAARARARAAS